MLFKVHAHLSLFVIYRRFRIITKETGLVLVCRSSTGRTNIYVIAIVKISNASIQNLFNCEFLQSVLDILILFIAKRIQFKIELAYLLVVSFRQKMFPLNIGHFFREILWFQSTKKVVSVTLRCIGKIIFL